MMSFTSALGKLDSFLWGWILTAVILFVGILMTIRSGAAQIFHFKDALKSVFDSGEEASGEISPFSALCASLSATVGTGNIIGAAAAISAGGPGALFWMLTAAFFSMATKYAEGLLAVRYRGTNAKGEYFGGPFYYIRYGLPKRFWWLSYVFAVSGLLAGTLGIGTMTQTNSIASAARRLLRDETGGFTLSDVIIASVVTILAAAVIFGGIKRLARFSCAAVPMMAAVYLIFSLWILFRSKDRIPSALSLIIKSAFDIKALSGAISGLTLREVIKNGIERGLFSNEAGLGSAPIAAAAAKTDSPARQGLVSMLSTFIDTGIVCTVTGLTVIVTGAWDISITGEPLKGVEITAFAWRNGLPLSADISEAALMICVICFAFTTVVGWNYYCEKCLEYLCGADKAPITAFRIVYIAAVFSGAFISVSAAWSAAGIFNAMMALPNLIALALLSKTVRDETKRFFKSDKLRSQK